MPPFQRPWQERLAVFGDTTLTSWPLAAMAPNKLHRLMILLKDVRVTGTVYTFAPGVGSGPFDYAIDVDARLSDGEITPITEAIRRRKFGLRGSVGFDYDGNAVTSDSVSSVWSIDFSIGSGDLFDWDAIGENKGNDLIHNSFVRVNGTDRYMPLSITVATADSHCNSFQATGDLASFVLSLFGETVPLGINGVADMPGNLVIEAAPTNAWLTFGGLRDPDTGHFTSNTF